MFNIQKDIKKTITSFQEFCDEYFDGGSSIEETNFNIFFIEDNSPPFQELIEIYNHSFNLYMFFNFKKIIPKTQLVENSYSTFLNKFDSKSNLELIFLRGKSPIRIFSSNSKIYDCLLQVWAIFIPNSIKIFLVERIRSERHALQKKIATFSELKEKNTLLSTKQRGDLLFCYNSFLLFAVQTIFVRQALFATLKSLQGLSFGSFSLFELILGIDFELVQALQIFAELVQLCQQLPGLEINKKGNGGF